MFRSIDLCVLRDACHKLFCVFGDFYASGTQDTEVKKSLKKIFFDNLRVTLVVEIKVVVCLRCILKSLIFLTSISNKKFLKLKFLQLVHVTYGIEKVGIFFAISWTVDVLVALSTWRQRIGPFSPAAART